MTWWICIFWYNILAWKNQPVEVWKPTHLPDSLIHEPLLFTPVTTRTLLLHFCKCWYKTPKTCMADLRGDSCAHTSSSDILVGSVSGDPWSDRANKAAPSWVHLQGSESCVSVKWHERLYVFRSNVKEEKPLLPEGAWRKQLLQHPSLCWQGDSTGQLWLL